MTHVHREIGWICAAAETKVTPVKPGFVGLTRKREEFRVCGRVHAAWHRWWVFKCGNEFIVYVCVCVREREREKKKLV